MSRGDHQQQTNSIAISYFTRDCPFANVDRPHSLDDNAIGALTDARSFSSPSSHAKSYAYKRFTDVIHL
jgi:hypothetical protein